MDEAHSDYCGCSACCAEFSHKFAYVGCDVCHPRQAHPTQQSLTAALMFIAARAPLVERVRAREGLRYLFRPDHDCQRWRWYWQVMDALRLNQDDEARGFSWV